MSLTKLFMIGGWAMWPLLIISIVTIASIVERTIYFFRVDLDVTKLREHLIEKKNLDSLQSINKALANYPKSLVALIFSKASSVENVDPVMFEKQLEATATCEVQRLDKSAELLLQIGTLAPMIGFLGTVSGMISAFYSISISAQMEVQQVAGGIFEALVTTAFGLLIAIVATASYHLFTNTTARFCSEFECLATEVLAHLSLSDHED